MAERDAHLQYEAPTGSFIRLRELAVNPQQSRAEERRELERQLRRLLRVGADEVLPPYFIRRRSVDARKGVKIRYSLLLRPEELRPSRLRTLLADSRNRREEYSEELPEEKQARVRSVPTLLRKSFRPLVAGMGPAGLFAALELARSGVPPILIERGKPLEERIADFDRMRKEGILHPESNAQFGEGGAGSFSDGKLTTRIHDPLVDYVLRSLVSFSAPEDILYEQRAHIGSDRLRSVLRSLRQELLALGTEIRFSCRAEHLLSRDGCFRGVESSQGRIEAPAAILAIGHSARDSYRRFFADGLALENKAFAMGFRIEHLQSFINRRQYGCPHSYPSLGAANYSVTVHPFREERRARGEKDRAVYSFCMCPGGEVIPASSEPGRLCVNGMSDRARDLETANAALLCTVDERDYGETLFAGMELQERIEEKTWLLGGGDFRAPVESVRDYLTGRECDFSPPSFVSSYRPGIVFRNLRGLYSPEADACFTEALALIEKALPGYCENALLLAAETRSSAPLRMLRDKESMESISMRGLYPAGEGAGYAGGIVSSAVDGIKAARKLLDKHIRLR